MRPLILAATRLYAAQPAGTLLFEDHLDRREKNAAHPARLDRWHGGRQLPQRGHGAPDQAHDPLAVDRSAWIDEVEVWRLK